MWEGINKKGEGIIFSQLSGLLNYQRFEKYLPIIHWIKRGEVYKNIEIQWRKRQGQEECSRITLVRVHAMDIPFWLWAKQITQLFRRAQTRWRSCWCHHGCKNNILYIHFPFVLFFIVRIVEYFNGTLANYEKPPKNNIWKTSQNSNY